MTSEIAIVEKELNGNEYIIEVEVWAKMVDESFDHAFGTHDPGYSIELTEIEISTVYDLDDNVITSRTIIKQLENMLDIDDKEFEDLDFDFSE